MTKQVVILGLVICLASAIHLRSKEHKFDFLNSLTSGSSSGGLSSLLPAASSLLQGTDAGSKLNTLNQMNQLSNLVGGSSGSSPLSGLSNVFGGSSTPSTSSSSSGLLGGLGGIIGGNTGGPSSGDLFSAASSFMGKQTGSNTPSSSSSGSGLFSTVSGLLGGSSSNNTPSNTSSNSSGGIWAWIKSLF